MDKQTQAIEIKEIKYLSIEYQQELILRDEVLRKPLKMSLFDENLDKEKFDTHFGAFLDKQLVGVLILTKIDDDNIKYRQMAVIEPLRKLNIGSQLVNYAENHAKKHQFKNIQLNAREVAIGFYEKLGFTTIGDIFFEVGIPHKKMIKEIHY